MEKVLITWGPMRYARERLSFEKVVLAGGAAVGRFRSTIKARRNGPR